MNRVMLAALPLVLLAFWTLVASWVTLWGLGTLDAVGWPTWHWWGYLVATMPNTGAQMLVNNWLMIGAGVGTVAAGMLAYRIVRDAGSLFGLGERPLHGASKFASRKEGGKSRADL